MEGLACGREKQGRGCLRSELGVQKKGTADNPAQADGLRDALGSHLTCVCILDKLSFWINHSLIVHGCS